MQGTNAGTDAQQARRPQSGARAGVDGLAPTIAVLVVSLAIAAVGVYELCGFGLHSLDRRPHLFSDGLATGGVIVAVVAAGAAVGNLAWHLASARGGTETAGPERRAAGRATER
ncbi:hypothetical protein ACWD5R_00210 [Streptomyces sp. NPDC002514]|uniref:hypothetical protein n=1 Tax=unclassified Streptomyces TaxID=2593676 RepID=UPI0036A21C32